MHPENFAFRSLAEFGLAKAADVLTQSFADYFVRIAFTPEMLGHMERTDSVDPAASLLVFRHGVPVGAALIARRGPACRLAAMGVVPDARRQGAGRALVARAIEDAKARGEHSMRLEVIEQNEPAVKLYENSGFTKIRRLVGFGGKSDGNLEGTADLEPAELNAAAAAVTKYAIREWPWQLSGETIAGLTPPGVAYRCGDAWVVTTDPTAATVTIRALAAGGIKEGAGLLRVLMAKYSNRTWRAAPIWPEELGAMFAEAGLTRVKLSQWQMIRPLG